APRRGWWPDLPVRGAQAPRPADPQRAGGVMLPLRMRVRWQGRSLVRSLAAGRPPETSAEHWLRASQLLAREHRGRLAAGLERVIEVADHPSMSLSAAIPPHRGQVRGARDALVASAALRRAAEPVCVQGVALVDQLLADGAGPLYAPVCEHHLAGEA